jgi:transcriptional antiterminator RfaH
MLENCTAPSPGCATEAKAITPSKWLVVNTQPHRESYACEHLLRQRFHVYCPMITMRIRHARSVHDAPRPLFPGYLFVKHHLENQAWRPILGTQGVKSLVRTGEQPSLLCGSFIEGLKARELEGVIRKPDVPLRVGQRVAVQGGPLDGFVGLIIEMRGKDRVLVLLNLLDQETRTHLRTESLYPL